MGGYTNAILAAIGNIGQARALNQLQRGQIYGGLAQQLGNAPMNYLAIQRGVNENRFRQTQQAEQERKLKAEAELRQLITDAPDGPSKWNVTRNWAAANDPELALQMDKLSYEAATNQYKAQYGQSRTPEQAGVAGQLPATATSPVIPLGQQEVPNEPIQFPSIAGRSGFTMTPPTRRELEAASNRQLGIVEQIKAMAGRFEKEPEIASREMEGQKNRENAMAIAKLREQTEGRTKVVKEGGQLRIKLLNPATGNYDIDQGEAPPQVTGAPGAGTTQLTTITTPEGPKLVEYAPGKGGKQGNIREIQSGAVRGTVPQLSPGVQNEITGLGLGAQSLNRLKEILPKVQTGPVWGRLRNIKVGALGGWGTTPDEIRVATQINMLMRSAFDTAGANFTEPEMNIFRNIYPNNNDTLETALVKIEESLKYIGDRMEIRKGLMTPMQRTQTKIPEINTGGAGTYSDPEKERRYQEWKAKQGK